MMLVVSLLSLISLPASAENTQITQWTGQALGNKNSWSVPMFRTPSHERMTIKVVPSGGSYNGISASDLARWMETSLIRQAQSLGPVRNISVFTGSASKGDLVLEVDLKVVSGQDFNRNYGSSSNSENWRGSSHSSSASGSDSREWTKMYVTIQPILYRVGEKDQREVIAAPSARISASESEMTASAEERSSSRSDSYNWRRGSSSSSHSESDGSQWRNDSISRDTMADGLVQRLSRQAISLTFQDLCQALQIERYGEIKDRETVTSQTVPQRDAEAPLEYSVAQ